MCSPLVLPALCGLHNSPFPHLSALACVSLAEAFREICPAGHGYTYSSSDIRLSMRKAEAEELSFSSEEEGKSSNKTSGWTARTPQLQESPRGEGTGTMPSAGTSVGEG